MLRTKYYFIVFAQNPTLPACKRKKKKTGMGAYLYQYLNNQVQQIEVLNYAKIVFTQNENDPY